MSAQLVLQECLLSDESIWKTHNCKLTQLVCEPNPTLTLLEHYQGLPEAQKDGKLSFELLKRMHEPMTVPTVARLLGIDERYFGQAFAVKYVGRAVIFCESPQIAIRFYFSNTAKPAQTVFLANKMEAIKTQAALWRAFGVVDLLYKGQTPLKVLDNQGDEGEIFANASYQSLSSKQSLAILELFNEVRGEFGYLDEIIQKAVVDGLGQL